MHQGGSRPAARRLGQNRLEGGKLHVAVGLMSGIFAVRHREVTEDAFIDAG